MKYVLCLICAAMTVPVVAFADTVIPPELAYGSMACAGHIASITASNPAVVFYAPGWERCGEINAQIERYLPTPAEIGARERADYEDAIKHLGKKP